MQGRGDNEPHVRRMSRQPHLKSHHLSSFGILNRNGLEIPTGIEMTVIEAVDETITSEYSAWLMPEPTTGYIKSKLHDFF